MKKKLSPIAVVALKEALANIYWYKSDLRSFLYSTISDKSILASINWDNYKRQIIEDLLEILLANQDRYLGDLTKLCASISEMTSFDHLRQLDGGEVKAKRAKVAVDKLRDILKPHEEIIHEEEEIVERQKRAAEKLHKNTAVRQKLNEINQVYSKMVISEDVYTRGFDLEKLMYDLFELFDLDPKASFKNTGEQIDGAFSLEGTEYLFEAKWQK